MPTNKTNNYNLSQWAANDRVLREDFNADNAKIDAALAATAAKADVLTSGKADATALAAEVQARTSAVAALNTKVAKLGNCQIYRMSYVGDGEATRTITFSHKPVIAFIIGNNIFMRAIYGVNQTTANSIGGEGTGCIAKWSGNSLTWTYDGAAYTKTFGCNYAGQTYQVVYLADAAE